MKTRNKHSLPRVGVVGPCASGKTTLIARLRQVPGIELRHIAQEHSYVPSMWQKISNPDLLIFLDVSYPVTLERRRLNWTEREYEEQHRRLAHAREHADLYLQTDGLSAEQVAEQVMAFLQQAGLTALD